MTLEIVVKKTTTPSNTRGSDPYLLDEQDVTYGNKVLGKGSNGTVIGAIFRNMKIALKLSRSKGAAEKEKEIHQYITELQNACIVQFIGFMLSEKEFVIAMEYMPKGSIDDFIINQEPLLWSQRLLWIKRITEGLEFLHKHCIVHRDIKGGNIFLDKNCNPKIGDFGTATRLQKGFLYETIGSPLWMAPEIILKKPYNEKVDIYSLAITIWQIVSWDLPSSEMSFMDFMKGSAVDERPELPNNLPAKLSSLITWGWEKDPLARPSAKELFATIEANSEETINTVEPRF